MIERTYFEWMMDKVTPEDLHTYSSDACRHLLYKLHTIDFEYDNPSDGNRYSDGISLRYRFAVEKGIDEREIARYIDNRPCSFLEMAVALSLRMEESM